MDTSVAVVKRNRLFSGSVLKSVKYHKKEVGKGLKTDNTCELVPIERQERRDRLHWLEKHYKERVSTRSSSTGFPVI